MKTLMCLIFLTTLISCSSSPFEEETERADKVMEHMSQGVRYSQGGFEGKYEESGIIGGFVIGVGKSVYPLSKSEQLSESAAISNAKFNIVERAPTTFESLVEKSINSEMGGGPTFSQKDFSVTRVEKLKGIEVKASDVSCKVRMEPTEDRKYRHLRECRARAVVRVEEMRKAFDYTLSKKLSEKISKEKVDRRISSQR